MGVTESHLLALPAKHSLRMMPNGCLENPALVSLPILTKASSWMRPVNETAARNADHRTHSGVVDRTQLGFFRGGAKNAAWRLTISLVGDAVPRIEDLLVADGAVADGIAD